MNFPPDAVVRPATPAEIIAAAQAECDQYSRCTLMLRSIFRACPAQLGTVELALQNVTLSNGAVLVSMAQELGSRSMP